MRTRRAVLARFALTLLLAACGGGGGGGLAAIAGSSASSSSKATPTTEHSSNGRDDSPTTEPEPVVNDVPQPGAADLVGSWLGPMPGDAGRCGSAISEWLLGADGSYQVTNRSTDCGGFTVFGTYSADDSTVAFEQQGSDCPTCIQTASYTVEYSFISDVNSLEIVDGTESFILHRQ